MRNVAGQCLLHLACNKADPNRDLVEFILASCPDDVKCLDNDGCSALHYACKKNNDGEIISLLGTNRLVGQPLVTFIMYCWIHI